MSEVVKAGVLEVTVVQAVGLDLLGSSSALSRTRRKPAVVARVTVDGTTRSGQPAPRSHHPVWFPAYTPSENAAARQSNSCSREGVARNSISGGSARVPGRPIIYTGDGDPSMLDRTRGRAGGVCGLSGGGGMGVGGGHSGGCVGCGCVGGSGQIGRGLLFEVREFYGPTRVVVDLVSGGGGSSSGGGGGAGGGTVLGRCEARLAEALVRRGSGSALAKSGTVFGLGQTARATQPQPISAFSPIPEAQTPTMHMETFGGGSGADATAPHPLLPPSRSTPDGNLSLSNSSESLRSSREEDDEDEDEDEDEEVVRTVAAPASTAAATTDTVYATNCTACLPGCGVLGRWRRRRARGQRNSSGSEDGSSVVDNGTSNASASGGSSARDKVDSSRRRTSWRSNSECKRSGAGCRSGAGSSSTVAKAAMGDSKGGARTLTLEEAETLATGDWGGGSGSAKDIWKEIVPVGSAGKIGSSKGSSGGSGSYGAAGPAVRLRLRFVPLWDCLADGGGVDGLGALHAAARDGDARLVTSLVQLWQSLSPGSQVLSLRCRRGLTPIQHCIETGKESALRELLRGIARDALRGGAKEGEDTALHTAVKAGEEGMLRMLLAATRRSEMPSRVLSALRFGLGTPPNTVVDSPGGDGLTPLALAAIYGNEAMVRCLLEEGANAAAVDASGMTPLAHAAQGGNVLAARALLKAKASGGSGSGVPGLRRSRLARMACAPCKTNLAGMGPVALAASSGSAQVVSELVRAEVPYRSRDREGRTPLHHAARGGHVSVLRVLVGEMRKGKAAETSRGGSGEGEKKESGLARDENTMMMDGGPFKLSSLDLSGRTAHATALLYEQPHAAAFLEAAAAELEPGHLKGKENLASKRKPLVTGSSSVLVEKGGHPPRASSASPILRLAQGSGSGSAQGSGVSGRPSPISSAGLGSGGSIVDSEDLSYEYCESDPGDT